MRRISTFLVILVGTAFAAEAQTAAPARTPGIPEVQRMVDAHQYAEARTALDSWWSANGSSAAGNQRARALFLRALLTESVADAERDYLRISIEHPSAPEADMALLRLGQARLAQGDNETAAQYLNRLRQDYPESLLRPSALLWLGRIDIAGGRVAEGCAAVAEGIRAAPRDPQVAQLLQAEQARACGRTVASAAPRTEMAPPPARQEPARQPAPRETAPTPAPRETTPPPPARNTPAPQAPAAPAAAGRAASAAQWTVQVSALSSVSRAAELRDELRGKGFDAYLVRVGNSPMTRVRVGTFASQSAAAPVIRALQTAGYEPIIARIEEG